MIVLYSISVIASVRGFTPRCLEAVIIYVYSYYLGEGFDPKIPLDCYYIMHIDSYIDNAYMFHYIDDLA